MNEIEELRESEYPPVAGFHTDCSIPPASAAMPKGVPVAASKTMWPSTAPVAVQMNVR